MPRKIPNFILQNIEKQIVSSESTAEEVSFEWSHHRISFMDSKLKPALEVSVIDSGIERATVYTQISAAVLIKFFALKMRRLFRNWTRQRNLFF